jgi:hypothetical protein
MKVFLFRNYNLPPSAQSQYDGTAKYKVWEAVRASSAAPGYYEDFKLDGYVFTVGFLNLIKKFTATNFLQFSCFIKGRRRSSEQPDMHRAARSQAAVAKHGQQLHSGEHWQRPLQALGLQREQGVLDQLAAEDQPHCGGRERSGDHSLHAR